MEIEDKERFIRWQRITIDYMGYAINTLLLITTASIGFIIAYLTETTIRDQYFYAIFHGTIILVFNVLLLLALIVNRLIDFRGTTSNIKAKKEVVDTKFVGKITWFLFYASILVFMMGQSFIVFGFINRILIN